MSVTVTDNGASAMLARARALDALVVRVGILADTPKRTRTGQKGGKLSLVEVAFLHEFGAPAARIPQRSFIRATVDKHAAEIRELQTSLAVRVLKGTMSVEQAAELLGAKLAAWCQNAISDGIPPGLKRPRPQGGTKPLVDTGQLKSSITWQVVA